MNKKSILFFGELPPGVVHGISLSNRLNIDLMSKHLDVHTIEEVTDLAQHGKRSRSKVQSTFRHIKQIVSLNRLERCDYFYTVFSLSTFGSLKTLGSLAGFKMSGKGDVVLHIHRGDFEAFFSRSFINKFITKCIFRLTNKLIVLSNRQKEHMARHVDKSKIHVLENSINTEYDFDSRPVGRNRFIFVSNYIREKGVFELLDTFTKSSGLKLKCFGSFVNNREEIERYRSDSIDINAFVDGEEKFQHIYAADALILPSWNEGQPTIILEAMMVGTIVLTTRVGLIDEILGPDYPFYFAAKNSDSLAQCISKFRDYEKKEKLSVHLKETYLKHYSKDIHEQKLLEIFA